jgi:hypothetical protein
MVDQYLSAERNWIDDPQELVDRSPYEKHIWAIAYAPKRPRFMEAILDFIYLLLNI